jgi:restriction system protein
MMFLFRANRTSLMYIIPAAMFALLIGLIALDLFMYLFRRKMLLHVSIRKIDKMSGVEFEQYLKLLYEKKGYKVKLTPGSNDYGADLILTKGNDKIAVQAKRYRSKVPESAVQQVIAAREYYHADRAAVVTNSLYTDAAKKLAKECRVMLINRFTLGEDF